MAGIERSLPLGTVITGGADAPGPLAAAAASARSLAAAAAASPPRRHISERSRAHSSGDGWPFTPRSSSSSPAPEELAPVCELGSTAAATSRTNSHRPPVLRRRRKEDTRESDGSGGRSIGGSRGTRGNPLVHDAPGSSTHFIASSSLRPMHRFQYQRESVKVMSDA